VIRYKPAQKENSHEFKSVNRYRCKKLTSTFSGQLLQPADVAYDDARKVHNGLVDKRPALIARSGGVADIVGAVELARNCCLTSIRSSPSSFMLPRHQVGSLDNLSLWSA
jgi:hypothetical protein